MTPTYQSTLTVLSRYLSRVNAQLALERALRRAQLTPATFGDQHLLGLVPHLERSLHLFVERARLPSLLAELTGNKQELLLERKVIELRNEGDLSEARMQARRMCQDLGAPSLTRQKVATLVSELARNILLYARVGRIELAPSLEPNRRIMVFATDEGPGIPNLSKILAGEYKSKTGLGMGLRGCKRLADRFDIETGTTGTRIVAEISV